MFGADAAARHRRVRPGAVANAPDTGDTPRYLRALALPARARGHRHCPAGARCRADRDPGGLRAATGVEVYSQEEVPLDEDRLLGIEGKVAALELVCPMIVAHLVQNDAPLRQRLIETLEAMAAGYNFPPDANLRSWIASRAASTKWRPTSATLPSRPAPGDDVAGYPSAPGLLRIPFQKWGNFR